MSTDLAYQNENILESINLPFPTRKALIDDSLAMKSDLFNLLTDNETLSSLLKVKSYNHFRHAALVASAMRVPEVQHDKAHSSFIRDCLERIEQLQKLNKRALPERYFTNHNIAMEYERLNTLAQLVPTGKTFVLEEFDAESKVVIKTRYKEDGKENVAINTLKICKMSMQIENDDLVITTPKEPNNKTLIKTLNKDSAYAIMVVLDEVIQRDELRKEEARLRFHNKSNTPHSSSKRAWKKITKELNSLFTYGVILSLLIFTFASLFKGAKSILGL